MACRVLSEWIDVGAAIKQAGRHFVEAAVYLPSPDKLSAQPAVFCCLPGGALDKGYFDLPVAGDESYSFARAVAEAGHIAIALDHPGIGASSVPEDGLALTIDEVAAADALAFDALLSALRGGTMDSALPPLSNLRSVGVGHSMGAMLTVIQQASRDTHSALVLLGFSGNGMREYLSERAASFIGDPAGARNHLRELVEETFGTAFPDLPDNENSAEIYTGGRVDAAAVRALRQCHTRLLGAGGLLSMIPGSIRPESEAVTVPVFLGVGDGDITGAAHRIPADFPGSADITLLVLPDTGHNHFLYASRATLIRRILHWVAAV